MRSLLLAGFVSHSTSLRFRDTTLRPSTSRHNWGSLLSQRHDIPIANLRTASNMTSILKPSAIQQYSGIKPWIQCPSPSTSPPVSLNGPRSQPVAKNDRQSVFPFFRLPGELRNLVYDFTLSDYSFEFYHVNMKFGASCRPVTAEDTNKASMKYGMTAREITRWPPCCVLGQQTVFL
jgi:hypothetical protein